MVKFSELLNFALLMTKIQSKVLVLFDFDGTITRKDSMLEFVKYVNGNVQFYLSFVILLPYWILYFTGLLSGHAMKEKFLGYFFKDKSYELLLKAGDDFCKNYLNQICKKSAIDSIYSFQKSNCRVAVVSASARIWVQAWADSMNVELICTELEMKNNTFTGKILGKNCNGDEKVVRVQQKFDLKEYERIIAFGDSDGDKPMLSLADEAYFRYFK